MTNKTILKKKSGEVIACGSERTATVSIKRVLKHPLYHKRYTVSRKFLCENPENKFKVGDLVEIIPCRPLSRRKHYLISRKTND